MIRVNKFNGAWVLKGDTGLMGSCVGSFLVALDAFAANWPELAGELDALRHDDLAGDEPQRASPQRQARPRPSSDGKPRLGSGARFRELYGLGKSNAEALVIVRAEFSDSKATLSDAAWNRARFRKEREALGPPAWDGLL